MTAGAARNTTHDPQGMQQGASVGPVDDARLRAAFAPVREWVFDLDNTLYCASRGLFEQIDRRMGEYLSRLFGVDRQQARIIQKDYFRRYGTTLHGLIANGEIADPDDFLAFVHDIDYAPIAPDPALDAALAQLHGRKWVFTNGSLSHAEQVLDRLGVLSRIDEIFDVKAAGYVPKPHAQAFDAFFRRTGISPASAAMFEDIARNLAEPHARGMTTVLVRHPANADADSLHAPSAGCGCRAGGDAAMSHPHDDPQGEHVHFRTSRLPEFLQRLIDTGAAATTATTATTAAKLQDTNEGKATS